MRKTLQGIVLRVIKFNDKSDIVHLFCLHEGRRAFLFRKYMKAKSHSLLNLYPLALIEFEASIPSGGSLSALSDPRWVSDTFQNESQLEKNAVSFYLAELIYRILPEGFVQDELFEFLFSAFTFFNKSVYSPNFHLWLTAVLIKEMGISPPGLTAKHEFLDLKSGNNSSSKPDHPLFLESDDARVFNLLFELKIDQLDELKLSGRSRGKMLDALVSVIAFHLVPNLHLNSLEVLKEVFA